MYNLIKILLYLRKRNCRTKRKASGAGSDEMKFITMKVVGGEPSSNTAL